MSLEDIKEFRVKKAKKLEEKTDELYPSKTKRDYSLLEVVSMFSKLSHKKGDVTLVGRIFGLRAHGGAIFCDFKDGSFDTKAKKQVSFQAFIKKDIVGGEQFLLFGENVDIGDFVEFKGELFKTKKGERSIKVSSWRVLAKSLRPLPEKWHGLSDVEERFRKRYLDLLMNDEVKSRFIVRSKIITEIRYFLDKNDFLEVETPMLQPLAGGALAEPFKTYHNALDVNLYLRIAPELYLKRLLVGGFEKVYELGRDFRNEGIDVTHNPEFTMLEFYEAYRDAEYAREFVEDMIKTLIRKIHGKKTISYEGNQIYFSKKFAVVSFYDVLKRHALINDPANISKEDYVLKARRFGVEVGKSDSKEKIADKIFAKACRPKLIQPTFIIDHPIGISPLSKQKKGNPELVDRFQLIIGGLELLNGFSELNDPIDQKQRFEKQKERRDAGDKEATEVDESYIEAMEYGMPPAVGVGIGIERLVMLLTGAHNIKEVILFPTMKPRNNE